MVDALCVLVVFCAALGLGGFLSESKTAMRALRVSRRWLVTMQRRVDAHIERRMDRAWQGDSERGFWGGE